MVKCPCQILILLRVASGVWFFRGCGEAAFAAFFMAFFVAFKLQKIADSPPDASTALCDIVSE
jgi:hypothetical protein